MTFKTKEIKKSGIYCTSVLKNTIILGSMIISLFFVNALLANSLHSHEKIQAVAVDFVRSQIPEDIKIKQITAGKIDSRIKFRECSQALESNSTTQKTISSSWTIGIRCNDNKPWSIYIPVKAKLTTKMLVSKTTITRGELISADKVKLIEMDITNQNKKHFSDMSNITGREARRTIPPNRVINSSMLQQALLVRKRESVMIYAQNNNIRVSMKGTALKNGRHNEMIKVRNNSSNKIIEALVVERGVVAVNF